MLTRERSLRSTEEDTAIKYQHLTSCTRSHKRWKERCQEDKVSHLSPTFYRVTSITMTMMKDLSLPSMMVTVILSLLRWKEVTLHKRRWSKWIEPGINHLSMNLSSALKEMILWWRQSRKRSLCEQRRRRCFSNRRGEVINLSATPIVESRALIDSSRYDLLINIPPKFKFKVPPLINKRTTYYPHFKITLSKGIIQVDHLPWRTAYHPTRKWMLIVILWERESISKMWQSIATKWIQGERYLKINRPHKGRINKNRKRSPMRMIKW